MVVEYNEIISRLDKAGLLGSDVIGISIDVDIQGFSHEGLIMECEYLKYITLGAEWPPLMIRDYALWILGLIESLDAIGVGIRDPHQYNSVYSIDRFVYVDIGSLFLGKTRYANMALVLYGTIHPLLLMAAGAVDQGYLYLRNHLPLSTFEDFSGYLTKEEKDRYTRLVEEVQKNLDKGNVSFAVVCMKNFVSSLRLVDTPYCYAMCVENIKDDIKRNHVPEVYKIAFEMLMTSKVTSIINLGGDNCYLALLMESRNIPAIHIDLELGVLNDLWRNARKLSPLYIDILSPTPPRRRKPVTTVNLPAIIEGATHRAKSNCAVAIDLVHRLVIVEGLSFHQIVSLFNEYTDRYILIEFIDKTDSAFNGRTEDYPEYTQHAFEQALNANKIFILDKRQLSATRLLYLGEIAG